MLSCLEACFKNGTTQVPRTSSENRFMCRGAGWFTPPSTCILDTSSWVENLRAWGWNYTSQSAWTLTLLTPPWPLNKWMKTDEQSTNEIQYFICLHINENPVIDWWYSLLCSKAKQYYNATHGSDLISGYFILSLSFMFPSRYCACVGACKRAWPQLIWHTGPCW